MVTFKNSVNISCFMPELHNKVNKKDSWSKEVFFINLEPY
jgi:hypothetical protein